VPFVFHRPVVAALIVVGVLAACESPPARRATTLTDDFGDSVRVDSAPARIVSLNPTTTEILFAIGAGSRVVGRTTYDQFPSAVKAVTDLGNGLRPNVEAVIGAKPRLVLLYASNDNRDAARRLRSAGIMTASYKVDRISDFVRVTRAIGFLVDDTLAAKRTTDSVQATLDAIRRRTSGIEHPSVFWPLWEAPLLSVGRGSFLNDLMEIAGGRNVFADLDAPSPTVAFEELVRRDPDVILMSAAGRERVLKDAKWRALRAVRDGRVMVVDSTISIGPSVRLGDGAMKLARLLHPDVKF
jgi:iron complex transport system substrate-binding protein